MTVRTCRVAARAGSASSFRHITKLGQLTRYSVVTTFCVGTILLGLIGPKAHGDESLAAPRAPDYTLASTGSARIAVCYNWSCAKVSTLDLGAAELRTVLARVERCANGNLDARLQRLRVGVWQMQVLAQRHLPVLGNDLAVNDRDSEIEGRSDCVDNASNTGTYLSLLKELGALPGWDIGPPQVRDRFTKDVHWTATAIDEQSGRRWAVDSWFRPNGHLPFVSPMGDWLKGRKPWEPPLDAWNPYPRSFDELCPGPTPGR